MVSLDKIQCVVMNYNAPACKELSVWLARTGIDWRYGISNYEIDVARNQNIRKFLEDDVPRGKEYLLSINDDMVPVRETAAILSDDGEVVYCGNVGHNGTRDHFGDGQFSSACFRLSARLLQSMEPPWFRVGHSGDVLRRTYCDCFFFKDRLDAAGIVPRMVGIVGHAVRCILLPDGDGYKVCYPGEFNYDKICPTP